MSVDPQHLLRELFATAIDAAHPRQVLEPYLPADRSGRVIVIGAGKAAAAMALVVENCWQGEVAGLVVTRYGHGAPCKKIEVVEAAHPVPDAAGQAVTKRVLELISNLSEDDRVIFLLSGGGSALLALPAAGITLADKQAINKALLKSGAAIDEISHRDIEAADAAGNGSGHASPVEIELRGLVGGLIGGDLGQGLLVVCFIGVVVLLGDRVLLQ